MGSSSAKATAISIGATVAIMYSICAMSFVISPILIERFASSIFHGVNLKPLEIGSNPFSFGEFFSGLICITAYALAAGFIYGTLKDYFRTRSVN